MSLRCFVLGFFRPASWRAIVHRELKKPSWKGYAPLRSFSTSHSWEPKPLESVPLGSGIAFSKNLYMDPEEVTERVLEVVKLFEKVGIFSRRPFRALISWKG